jgi:hypothetical protein
LYWVIPRKNPRYYAILVVIRGQFDHSFYMAIGAGLRAIKPFGSFQIKVRPYQGLSINKDKSLLICNPCSYLCSFCQTKMLVWTPLPNSSLESCQTQVWTPSPFLPNSSLDSFSSSAKLKFGLLHTDN